MARNVRRWPQLRYLYWMTVEEAERLWGPDTMKVFDGLIRMGYKRPISEEELAVGGRKFGRRRAAKT